PARRCRTPPLRSGPANRLPPHRLAAAAGPPCRSGSSGGSARSSPRSPPAPPAAPFPSQPSPATLPIRTPSRRAPPTPPLPALIPREHVVVASREHLRPNRTLDRSLDLLAGGPDLSQVDRLAVLVLAERLREEVHVHPPGERVGNAERGRAEVVVADVLVDAAL